MITIAFVMCEECHMVLGPLVEHGDWTWTIYNKQHNKNRKCKHNRSQNIDIPIHMVNPNIMSFYPKHWRAYYQLAIEKIQSELNGRDKQNRSQL